MNLDDLLASFAGRRVPGGCDDCDAFQQMRKEADGVFVLAVHHGRGCPWLARPEAS